MLAILISLMTIGEVSAQRSRIAKTRKHRTHRVVGKKKKAGSRRKTGKRTKRLRPVDPTLNDPFYNPYLQCEDTCKHVHGIDLSHYQGEVFWETVGDNTKMAYVYLKATEGGHRDGPASWPEGRILSFLPAQESPAASATELYDAVSSGRTGPSAND